MTSLTSLLRDHTADPQPDRMPRIAAVVEREGRAAEFLDALRDRERWNAAPSNPQDIAAAVVGSRLGAGFEWVGMEWFECRCRYIENPTFGTVGYDMRSHRIARFRHRATGAMMHLVLGDLYAGFPYSQNARPSDGPAAPFLVGQTPVTVMQVYGPAMDGHRRIHQDRDDLPEVGWDHDAVSAFLRGLGLRLPSPAEWRHAAYAGATTRWPWGDEWSPEGSRLVWYAGNSNDGIDPGGHWDRPILHSTRDHLQARAWNAFGLVDMIGNVDEWLADGRYVAGGSYLTNRDAVGLVRVADTQDHSTSGFRAFACVPGVE